MRLTGQYDSLVSVTHVLAAGLLQRGPQIGEDLTGIVERGPEVRGLQTLRLEVGNGGPDARDGVLEVAVFRGEEGKDLDLHSGGLMGQDLVHDKGLGVPGVSLDDVADLHGLTLRGPLRAFWRSPR